MGNMKDFSHKIKLRANTTQQEVDKIVRETALVIDREVVVSTPVDTGRARSNWIVNIKSPARKTQGAYVPGGKGSTASANVQAALAQGEAVVATRKTGQDIYISNNLSYISDLNNGSSAQAPAQFIQMAIQAAVAFIRKSRVVKNGN